MKNLIDKVEALRDKFSSHYAMEENAYNRACDDVIEVIQKEEPEEGESLPIKFISWYSGMDKSKILKAYERYKVETGNPQW